MTVVPGSNRFLTDVVINDPATGLAADPNLPSGGAQVRASSGNVANAAATATLPAVIAKTNYLSGLQIFAGGATAGSIVLCTITGLLGGSMVVPVTIPAGATLASQVPPLSFYPPLPASAPNTAIVVTLAAAGAGNTNAAVDIQGYVK